jgi:hypothetical protein
MVIEADKSRTTGWGDNLPQWHTKYRPFAGYVYFRSSDVRELPWTTTKQNVVVDSTVYQAALAEMQVQARPIITFLNNLYPGEYTEDDVAERQILASARTVSLVDLPRTETMFIAKIPAKRDENRLVSIQYRKPRRLLDRIKAHLSRRSMSASAIGEFTFDYYVEQEVDQ